MYRYSVFMSIMIALMVVWFFYVESFIERFRAGEIDFLQYYALKYEVTPVVMQGTNVVIVIAGIILLLIALRDKSAEIQTQD